MGQFNRFAEAFLDASPDAVLGIDEAGQVMLANAQAAALLGYRREDLCGRSLEDLLTNRRHSKSDPGEDPLERAAHRSDGKLVPVEVSLAPVQVEQQHYIMAVLRDLTDRRHLEARLLYMSSHDALTGVANRFAFDETIARLDDQGPHPVGVLMVDVDDLKVINDERGHGAGDAILRRAGQLLRATFRSSDVVARIGGDEFAVLVGGHDRAAMEVLLQRLTDALSAHNRERDWAPLQVSMGLAVAEGQGVLPAALQRADAQMYAMKRSHHGH